jgi:hypothetical protein
MEYVSYILVVLGVLTLVLLWALGSGQIQFSNKSTKRSHTDSRLALKHHEQSKVKQLAATRSLNIPTPWGWPGHDGDPLRKNGSSLNTHNAHGTQNSLHRFVDLMMSEKQTVESREYLLKKDASMRALLDGRFGHSGIPEAIKYQKVKAPLLRDPSEPIDQMDSFNSNEAMKIVDQLLAQEDLAKKLDGQGPVRKRAYLGEVKTPWGW